MVRAGHQWSVHWKAFSRYQRTLSESFDIIVDETNTIPFFTPLWSNIPVVMFIHQLAREVWWYESRFPLSEIGYFAEPRYLSFYRRIPILTVSESTRRDLIELGFKGPITVLPAGLEQPATVESSRPVEPAFLYVGRLTPSKRVADLILAFAMFCNRSEPGELTLVGTGSQSHVSKLKTLAADLGVLHRIRFKGYLSKESKRAEMANAHMLLMASVREGWGLVVTEANAYGTPVVAYNVPGLRDSVRHQETGLLADATPRRLADRMIELWSDRALYGRLSAAAKSSTIGLTFDQTAHVFRGVLLSVFESGRSNPHQLEARDGSV